MSAGQNQEFCVRWNSHLGSIGAAFPQLLAGQRFVDVTLACEGHQVHCHRLVLAACSSYFEAILAENPCKHPIIILPSEIKLWEIQALVDFMYKGEVNVTQAGLPQLLRCAEQLRIRGLHGSDAALNLNQLKALSHKAATLATIVNEHITTESESTNDTATPTTSATASTNTTTTTANVTRITPTATQVTTSTNIPPNIPATITTNNLAQQQHILSEQFIKKEPHSNRFTAQLKQQRQSNGQIYNQQDLKHEINNTRSNFSSADDEEDEDDSVAAAGSPAIAFNQSEEFISTLENNTLDDDHSYVVSNNEDDSFNEIDTNANNNSNSLLMSGSFKRVRRSEASLAQAAKCVSKGETFQTVSNMFNIPVSTIRFFMARKGILPKRKRGRGAASNSVGPMMSTGTLADLKQQQHIQLQQQQQLQQHDQAQQQQQQQQQQQHLMDEDQFHMISDFKIEEQDVNLI